MKVKTTITGSLNSDTLCVCRVVNEEIYPLSWWLTREEATQSLAWNKTGAHDPDSFKILDMKTMDLSKLNLKCYIDEYKIKYMAAFKKAQNKQ